jgi:hypothetical protein
MSGNPAGSPGPSPRESLRRRFRTAAKLWDGSQLTRCGSIVRLCRKPYHSGSGRRPMLHGSPPLPQKGFSGRTHAGTSGVNHVVRSKFAGRTLLLVGLGMVCAQVASPGVVPATDIDDLLKTARAYELGKGAKQDMRQAARLGCPNSEEPRLAAVEVAAIWPWLWRTSRSIALRPRTRLTLWTNYLPGSYCLCTHRPAKRAWQGQWRPAS